MPLNHGRNRAAREASMAKSKLQEYATAGCIAI
jgi:hypothetical protein